MGIGQMPFYVTPPASTTGTTSPPSTASMATHHLQMPTPAHSNAMNGSDGDMEMRDEAAGFAQKQGDGDVEMGDSGDHRPTDHEREGDGSLADDEAAQDWQNAAKGPPFKLGENPPPRSRPHPSQDLISLYGLTGIANRFRRNDPVTGEKIKENVLRKSYEGKLKALKLAGKNKPYKQKETKENEPKDEPLWQMLLWPAEEWYIQNVHGHDMKTGLSGSLGSKLDRALQMNPGKYTGEYHDKFKALLGPEDASKSKGDSASKKAQPAASQVQAGQVGGRSSAAPSPNMRPSRPERAGTKRRYNDTSFTGYGEGFPDDDTMDSAGGEDGGRRGSVQKKRRKEATSTSPLASNGFNVGHLVSVRR